MGETAGGLSDTGFDMETETGEVESSVIEERDEGEEDKASAEGGRRGR